MPEKQSTESKVDSPKEPVERKNSNEVEIIEDNKNEKNITVIVID